MPTRANTWPAGGGEMGARIRAHDWAATPLGPLAEWPQSLRTAVDIMLASPGPVSVLWGAERTQLYNDAYIPIAAARHPVILGLPAAANWPDAYAGFLGPILDRVYAGEAVVLNHQVVPLCAASGEDSEDRVFTATFSPIRDETGAVAGVFHPLVETTEQVRADAARRESEERYRLAIEAYQGGVSEYFPQTEEVWGSSTYSQLFGEDSAEGPRKLDHFYARVHPDDLERTRQAVASLLAGQKKLLDIEYRARHARGHWIHLWTRAVVLRAEAGEASRIIATTVDVSKRKRAEAALRESEERLRLALDVGRLATWDWDIVADSVQWNDEHYRILGYGVGEVSPSYEAWLARIHPDDRDATVAALARAREERSAYIHEFRYLLPDGGTRWCAARGRFFYARRGKPVRMIGVMEDVTERVRAEDYQRLLLSELQHRVRNTLAVVRSIARRTAASSETIEDYTAHFDGRLNAFARTQAAVTRDPSGGVDLETLLAEELMAHGAREGGQVHLDGPPIRLQPKAAEMIGLAVHELTTNAVKYGALSTPVGRLDVRWAIDGDGDDRCLTLRWVEDLAGRPVLPFRRRGFGFEMLERTLAYDLGAETRLEFTETGLHCTLDLPLDSRVGHAGT